MSDELPSAQGDGTRGLGTFLGVFTPTILTILGVMLYLRLGWVVGNAGLYGAIGIILFANAITLLTALSLSALATNMRMGVGGAYYLISRTLGLEVGGAIGIPLYLSQALSVTLYCYGLSETLFGRIDASGFPLVPVVAGALVIGVGLVAARSASFTLKLQLPMLGLIVLSVASLLLGVDWGAASQVPAVGPWTEAGPWAVFAVFFPAVTGILAGVSLSGDLREPGEAIPRGMLSAVAVGLLVYLVVPFALAKGASPALLLDAKRLEWTVIAAVPLLVLPGMWGAILSSAFGSMLGAPRTLQALAHDRIAPATLSEVDADSGEPVLALRVTIAVAFAAVFLGNLNAVATVLTMFFLTTYGTLNLVAGIEELVGDPSFRPRIRIPWWLSFLGAIGCLVAMIAISPIWSVAAIVLEVVIYGVLSRRSMEAAWGDVRGGMLLTFARFALIRLRGARMEPRNWRPHILVFTTDPHERIATVRMAEAFSQHRGITSVMTLLLGDIEEHTPSQHLASRHQALLDAQGVTAFCDVATVPDLHNGVITCAQANGFAGLDSNTAMFGWPDDDPAAVARVLSLTRKLCHLHKCTLLYRDAPVKNSTSRDIIVWWKGREHNGDLMLLLAHLLTVAPGWRDARIVLKTVVSSDGEADERRLEFGMMLTDIRIAARVEVVVPAAGEGTLDALRRNSQEAALVFLGMDVPAAGDEPDYARRLIALVEGLPPSVLVRNAGPFRGRLL